MIPHSKPHTNTLSNSEAYKNGLHCVLYSEHPLSAVPLYVCVDVGLDVLDDDSGRLGEITELFSDLTLPVKVEKLVKVSFILTGVFHAEGEGFWDIHAIASLSFHEFSAMLYIRVELCSLALYENGEDYTM